MLHLAWGEGAGEMLHNSYSYSMVLTSCTTKALEGAGLALPLTLLNPLEGACRCLPNGKIVMFPQSHTAKEISWIRKEPFSIALFYNLTCVFRSIESVSVGYLIIFFKKFPLVGARAYSSTAHLSMVVKVQALYNLIMSSWHRIMCMLL